MAVCTCAKVDATWLAVTLDPMLSRTPWHAPHRVTRYALCPRPSHLLSRCQRRMWISCWKKWIAFPTTSWFAARRRHARRLRSWLRAKQDAQHPASACTTVTQNTQPLQAKFSALPLPHTHKLSSFFSFLFLFFFCFSVSLQPHLAKFIWVSDTTIRNVRN